MQSEHREQHKSPVWEPLLELFALALSMGMLISYVHSVGALRLYHEVLSWRVPATEHPAGYSQPRLLAGRRAVRGSSGARVRRARSSNAAFQGHAWTGRRAVVQTISLLDDDLASLSDDGLSSSSKK